MENVASGHDREINTAPSKARWRILEEHARLWMAVALLVTDWLGLYLVLNLALQVCQLPGLAVDVNYNQIYGLLALTMGLLFARKGLYPGVGINYVKELGQVVSSANFAFLIVSVVIFLLNHGSLTLRLVLALTWFLSLGSIPAIRYFMRRLLIRFRLWGEPVVIIGNSAQTQTFSEHFKINMQLGLRPVKVLTTEHCVGCLQNCNITSDTNCLLKAQARTLRLSTALIVITDLNDVDDLIDRFRNIFHRVILVKYKKGRYGLSSLEVLDFSAALGLEAKNNLLSFSSQVLKRSMDILVSAIGLLVLAPLFVLIALLIKLDSPGSVFYRQVRLGRDGKSFNLLKFRSMYQDADQKLQELLEQEPALRVEWEKHQKLKHDPRITRVGRFLRKFSLDEFPQLWNVFKSEMSLVGPRPIMVNQRILYGDNFEHYMQVTPGMTGLWQVSGRNNTTFSHRALIDYEYLQCWSLWLDIYILVKTVKVVFLHRDTY